MNWRTANNRRRTRQKQCQPAFTKRNLDRWRGLQWADLTKAMRDERLGFKRSGTPRRP